MRPAAALGRLSDDYRLGDRLSRSGVAEIHLAEDLRLGRTVRITFVSLTDDGAVAWARLREDALKAAGLVHPNVAPIYDVGEDGGRGYLVSAHGARTLADEIREAPLADAELRRVAQACAAGIRAAHEAGLAHGAIEPAHVFVATDGRAQLDLGPALAVRLPDAPAPLYVAPELADEHDPTVPGDLYALGMTLNEAVTGRPAVGGSPPLRVRFPGRDSDLLDAIDAAVHADASCRFPSASAMAQALGGDTEEAATRELAPPPDHPSEAPPEQTAVLHEPPVGTPEPSHIASPAPAAAIRERLAVWSGSYDRRTLTAIVVVLAFVGLMLVLSLGDSDPIVPGGNAPTTEQSPSGLPPEIDGT